MSMKGWLDKIKAKIEIQRKKLVEESQQKRDKKKRDSLRKAQERKPGVIQDIHMGYNAKKDVWDVMNNVWKRRRYERKQKK